jgi:hypothetical protein
VKYPVKSALLYTATVAICLGLPILLAAQQGAPAGGAAAGAQGAPTAPRAGGPPGRGRANLPPAGPTPRMANGKPDLSGHWTNPYTPNMARGAVDPMTRQPLEFARKGEQLKDSVEPRTFDLPYTDWGLKQWKGYDPVNKGDYAGTCLPFGLPRNMNSPHGVQILANPDAVAFLFEQNTWHMWVPTNPSFKWPEDLPETWNGTSVGRWDGDTLIIETKNFNGYTKLDTNGHPHSKGMVMTNTFKRLDSNTMEHTILVHDPKAYTKDWMNVRTWRIKPTNDVLMEYSCEENNLQSLLEGAIKMWKPPTDID